VRLGDDELVQQRERIVVGEQWIVERYGRRRGIERGVHRRQQRDEQ
jgi:hypothetical protein